MEYKTSLKVRERAKLWLKENREKANATKRAYYRKNREKILEKNKKSNIRCVERLREYRKKNRRRFSESVQKSSIRCAERKKDEKSKKFLHNKRKKFVAKICYLLLLKAGVDKSFIKNENKNLQKEKQCLRYRKYYEKNKQKIIARAKLHKKKAGNKYYKNNIEVRLKIRLRNRLGSALKNNQKKGKTLDYLGCNVEELKLHLEKQFTEGMTWDNWGKNGWHIDHIKPLVSFDLSKEENIKIASHYSNLQPLWAKDNLEKWKN
jgi:hypothetical protein